MHRDDLHACALLLTPVLGLAGLFTSLYLTRDPAAPTSIRAIYNVEKRTPPVTRMFLGWDEDGQAWKLLALHESEYLHIPSKEKAGRITHWMEAFAPGKLK